MKWRRGEPILITSAAEARPEEIRRREQRYILTMLFRVVCFVLAVVAFSGWLRIVAVGLAVILPWVAVVVANGGPPRSDRRQAGFVARDPAAPDPLELSAGHPVVDATVVDPDAVDADAGVSADVAAYAEGDLGGGVPESTGQSGPPDGEPSHGPVADSGDTPGTPAGSRLDSDHIVIDAVVVASRLSEPPPPTSSSGPAGGGGVGDPAVGG